jgi:hypothetical protein
MNIEWNRREWERIKFDAFWILGFTSMITMYVVGSIPVGICKLAKRITR